MGDGVRKRRGKWWVRYMDAHGVRREVPIEASSRTEAKEKRARVIGKVRDQRLGIWDGDAEATIADVFASYAKVNRNLASWRTVEMWFRRHILPALGKKKLRQMTKGEVQLFLNKKTEEGLAPQSCEHLRMRLSVLFNYAREEGVFRGDNPAAKVDPVQVPEKPPVYLEAHHIQLVLDAADERWRNLFACAVYLGLRLGEFRALTTKDVDLVNRVVRVWRSGSRKTTKTGRYRLVPIPLAAMVYIKPQCRAAGPGGHLFTYENGKPFEAHVQPAKPLRRALKKAGLADLYPNLRFHDLRKTFGTHVYEASGDLTAAARLMGNSEEVARQIYVASSARRMGALVDRMDFKKLPPPSPRTVVDGQVTDVQSVEPKGSHAEESGTDGN